jgi:hypothetical protein
MIPARNNETQITYRTGTEVPNLSTLDNVVQCLHDLLARRLPVQSVDLQDIDICAETLNASINRIKDMLARKTGTVNKWTVVSRRCGNGREVSLIVDTEETLGENHHAIARDVVLLQSLSDNLLGFAMGVNIGLVAEDQRWS